MPAQAKANVIALQLEKVRDKVPLLYERDDILLTMIQQRGDVEKVSSPNMRLPLQVNPGGKAGPYNPAGGELRRGSRPAVRQPLAAAPAAGDRGGLRVSMPRTRHKRATTCN